MVCGESPNLRAAIEDTLGVSVERCVAVGGGDIASAYRVTLSDGSTVFVKTHASGASMFAAEAEGLRWLSEGLAAAQASSMLQIAEVLAVRVEPPALLILRHVERGRPAPDHDVRLGRGLAALHRSGATCFGHHQDNFIGSLPQDNRSCPTWPTFYWERRLFPLVQRASQRKLLEAEDLRAFEQLERRLPELVGEPEPPARLHGDLWGGNAMTGAQGQPVLIDPAVYGGHREMDLAMMRLFGGFSPRCFAAYDEAWPLSPGSDARVPLYQLYPLLVHVCLFGRGYVGQLRAALRTACR